MQTGHSKSLGVLVPAIVKDYNTDHATAGAIASAVITMTFCSQILSTPLQKLFPAKPLAVTSGLIAGVCMCCSTFTRNVAQVMALFVIGGFFDGIVALMLVTHLHRLNRKWFPSACTLSHVVSLCGGIVMPPLTEKMYEAYGLFGTLLLLGGFMLNEVPIGMSVESAEDETLLDRTEGHGNQDKTLEQADLRIREDTDDSRHGKQEAVNGEIFEQGRDQEEIKYASAPEEDDVRWPLINEKDRRGRGQEELPVTQNCHTTANCIRSVSSFLKFNVLWEERTFSLIILPCAAFQGVVNGGWVVFCVSYGLSVGLDGDTAALLPLVGAIGGIISRLLFSYLLLRHPDWSPQLFLFSLVMGTATLFAQTAHSSEVYLVFCTFIIGFGLLSASVLIDALVSSTVAEERFPDCIAFMMFSVGISTVSAGSISGYLYDRSGSVKLVFIVLASLEAACILITLFLFTDRRRQGNSDDVTSDQ